MVSFLERSFGDEIEGEVDDREPFNNSLQTQSSEPAEDEQSSVQPRVENETFVLDQNDKGYVILAKKFYNFCINNLFKLVIDSQYYQFASIFLPGEVHAFERARDENQKWALEAMHWLIDQMKMKKAQYDYQVPRSSPPPRKRNRIEDFIAGDAHQPKPLDPETEYKLYTVLVSNLEKEELLDPFGFWKRHHKSLPFMSLIAKDFLCVCSTSIGAERVFSAAKLQCSPLRASMLPDTLEKRLILSANRDIVFPIVEKRIDQFKKGSQSTQN